MSLTTVTPVTVMPAPETFTALAPVKPAPVRVTGTLLPRTPEAGAIEASVGARTLNVTPLLFVPPVVTVTVRAETLAVFETVNVAVIVVELTTVSPLTVIPVPETLIAVVPVRFVPVRVTETT